MKKLLNQGTKKGKWQDNGIEIPASRIGYYKTSTFSDIINAMEKIKLICSDVDGTLINAQGQITTEDKKALSHAVKDLGLAFAIVSGRFRGGLGCIQRQLDFTAAMSCFNGLYIEMDGKAVQNSITDKSCLLEILPLIRGMGCTPVIFSLDDWVMEDKNIWYRNQIKACGFEGRFMNLEEALAPDYPMDFYKILAKHTDHQILENLKTEFLKLGSTKLDAVFSSPNILELIPRGTTKADTVDILARHLGITRENVMAFGDYDNDIGMLERAGFGVCMENGTAATKAVARYITASNEEGGIAQALEKFVF